MSLDICRSQREIKTSTASAKIVHYGIRGVRRNHAPAIVLSSATWNPYDMFVSISENVSQFMSKNTSWIELQFVEIRRIDTQHAVLVLRAGEKRACDDSAVL